MFRKICSGIVTCSNSATYNLFVIGGFFFSLQVQLSKPAGYRIKTAKIQMRKILLFLVILFPNVFCLASGEEYGKQSSVKGFQPDSTVYTILGPTISDILFKPNRVTCYTIKGKGEIESRDFQVEPHWVRDSLVGKLSPQMVGVLQFALIANSENYKNDTLRIKAPYFPVLEFEFQKKKDIVHVLISISDHTWTIVYGGERQINYNYHDCELISRFCDMFIKLEE